MLPSIITSWEVFMHSSPHPWAAPPNVILVEQLSAQELQFFEQVLRLIVESPET